MPERVGIYFLGDDGVYDWASTLLTSIRAVDPDVEVWCIPFSTHLSRLSRLQSRLRFDFFEHESLLELDEIGRKHISRDPYFPRTDLAGLFRKLAVFWGPLDTFMYMDADVAVLDGFREFFEAAASSTVGLQYALSEPEKTYRPGTFRDTMVEKFKSPEFNSGLWMSRHGTVTLANVREAAVAALEVVTDLWNLDQPFVNYCLDINRVDMQRFNVSGFECAWPGEGRDLSWHSVQPGKVRMLQSDGRRVPAIHWAGYRLSASMPYYNMHRQIRTAAMPWNERCSLSMRELADSLRNSSISESAFSVLRPVFKRSVPSNIRLKIRKACLPDK